MRLPAFLTDTSGAVTVDWVVLAGSVVGLGMASVVAVQTGVVALGSDIDSALASASVASVLRPLDTLDVRDTDGLEVTPWGWVAIGSYRGWQTLGANDRIEISRSGQRMVTPDGDHWIDLEYHAGNMTLARSFDGVTAGQPMVLSFNAADSSGNNAVDIYFGGALVQRVDPANGSFNPYSISLIAGSGDGSNQLEFRGQGPEDGAGVSLHGIVVH